MNLKTRKNYLTINTIDKYGSDLSWTVTYKEIVEMNQEVINECNKLLFDNMLPLYFFDILKEFSSFMLEKSEELNQKDEILDKGKLSIDIDKCNKDEYDVFLNMLKTTVNIYLEK